MLDDRFPLTDPSHTTASTTSPERPRPLRRSPAIRALVRENRLRLSQLVLPLFVVHGSGVEREISSLPGVHHLSVDSMLDREIDAVQKMRIVL